MRARKDLGKVPALRGLGRIMTFLYRSTRSFFSLLSQSPGKAVLNYICWKLTTELLPLKFNLFPHFSIEWQFLPHSTKQSHLCIKVPDTVGLSLNRIILIPKEHHMGIFSTLLLLTFKNSLWPLCCWPCQVFEWIINCKLDPWTD